MNNGLESSVSSASGIEEETMIASAGNDTPGEANQTGNQTTDPNAQQEPVGGQTTTAPTQPTETTKPTQQVTQKPAYQGFVATEDNTKWLAGARVNRYDEIGRAHV